MTIVNETLDLPTGTAPTKVTIEVQLVGDDGTTLDEADDTVTGTTIVGLRRLTLDAAGAWTADLPPNVNLSPAGTVWRRTAYNPDRSVDTASHGTVPTTGPVTWRQIRADPPGEIESAALGTHRATPLDGGVHGIVERNWAQDGTTGLTRQVMTQDGSNGVSASVSGGFLVFTALGAGDGQHEVWKLADTNWVDSEMTSLIGRSDLFGAPPNAAQWGHLHRVQDQGGGTWKAFACWTDVQFTIPPILNIGVVSWNGTVLTFQIINALEWANMLRHLPIYRAKRVSNVTTYWTHAPWIRSLAVGDTGAVTGMAVAGFDQATTAITAIDLTQRSFSLANTGANATDADAGGTFAPVAPHSTLPMMLSSRLVGNTIQAKQWRPEEAEPDWSDSRFVFTNAVVGGTPSPHSGLGDCGLWVAHLQTPNKQRYGGVRARRLSV